MDVTLTVTGRRSGDARTVRLFAFADGDRLVVVGSRGGDVRDPYWAENLRADPRAIVRVGDTDARPVRAIEVGPEDRDRLWALVSAQFATYDHYQRKTKRLIPLFVLERITDGTNRAEAPA